MEELNEVNLRKAMHELTEQKLIPDYLKVEMCLMPDAMLITDSYMDSFGNIFSKKYPGLILKVSNKVGWELYGSLPSTEQ